MKKISTIIGVGMISMAVALAPAFAQQTKSQDPASSSTAVQPKVDEKAPLTAPAAKDEKSLPAKKGMDAKSDSKAMPEKSVTGAKSESVPAKPGADVKAATAPVPVPSKTGTDVKSGVKAMPENSVTGAKSESVPAKPGADVKAGAVQGKSDTGAKGEKAATVEPGKDMKSHHGDKAVKSGVKSTDKTAHPAKGSVKTTETSKDADSKTGSSNPVKPSTGN